MTATSTHAPRATRPRRQEAPATPPDLRLVSPVRHVRRFGGLVVLGALGLLFGLVFLQVLLVQNQHHIDSLNARLGNEQATYQRLRLEVAEMEAPDRIVREATKLGLVEPPGAPVYLTPSAEDARALGLPAGSVDQMGESTSDWPRMKPYLQDRG